MSTSPRTPRACKEISVVVVDDETSFRTALAENLRDDGHPVRDYADPLAIGALDGASVRAAAAQAVRVTHVISSPLAFDPALDPTDRAAVERAQLALWSACQRFLDRAVARRPSDAVDAISRRGIGVLRRLGV